MININLLPEDLRPVKRTPIPYIASALVAAAAVMAMGMTYTLGAAEAMSERAELRKNQAALDKLQPVVDEYNALSAQKEKLAVQVQVIDDIARDRIVWSRQLYNLNRLALKNLWYDSIAVTMKPYTQTVTVYDPQRKQNIQKTERRERPVLTLSGYVVPGEDGQSSISPFTLVTDEDEEFSDLFQLDLSTFRDTEFKEHNVRSFKLEYIIQPGGAVQ
jgi:Tfp pilus assembly protein PilN